jgi:PadR family transcriptional regulator PadR
VLNLLQVQEGHGYQIVQRLKEIDGLDIRESTVYPILARMKTEGFVAVRDEPSPGGPPRRVFRLSASGRERMRSLNAYWDLLTEAVDQLRSGRKEASEGNLS